MSIGFFGCNFRCDFCQNFDISCTKGPILEQAVAGLNEVSPQKFVDLARKSKAQSIAFTYNEPAISVEYNLEAIKLAKVNSRSAKKSKANSKELASPPPLGTVYVSNGYASEEQIKALAPKKKSSPRLDAINIDLKSFNEKFYWGVCGAKLEEVLKTIKSFHKAGVWVELTTLLIPGKNDFHDELEQIAEFISSIDKNIPWHLTGFFPTHRMQNVSPTSREEIASAARIGKDAGLKFVYGGNSAGAELENTFCPKCNNLLIKRSPYGAETGGLSEEKGEKNKCQTCGEKISGVFE